MHILYGNRNLWYIKLPLCANDLWQISHGICVQKIVDIYYINIKFVISQVTIVCKMQILHEYGIWNR